MKLLKPIKNVILLFCIIFTFATLFSCIINILLGYETDTYTHIIDRAVLTLLGAVVVTIILEIKFKSKIVNFLLPYTIFIILAILYVYISGFFQELHPNAYRDVFLNDTAAYIFVYFCLAVYQSVKQKQADADKNKIAS